MTDIPALIERLQQSIEKGVLDGDDSDSLEAMADAAEALSALTASPLPGEVENLLKEIREVIAAEAEYSAPAHCAVHAMDKAASLLERMARENERLKLRAECGFCDKPFGKFGGICESCHGARIRELEAERDKWKAASGSGSLADLSQEARARDDAIRAKTLAECLNTIVTVRGFGTASDDYLQGFHDGALAKTDSIRALHPASEDGKG